MSTAGLLPGLVGHELRLLGRDTASTLRAGRRGKLSALIVAILFLALLHGVAWATVGRYASLGDGHPDVRTYLAVTTALGCIFCLLLSQAIESVTRLIYGRGDLDLVLASPVPPATVLIIRVGVVAASMCGMTLFITAPFTTVLVLKGGAAWLGLLPVAIAAGLLATAAGLVLTLGLIKVAGSKRARLLAQVAAAVVGAAFAIGLQIAAILQYGQISRFAVVMSDAVVDITPDVDHPVWIPARAATGDAGAIAMAIGIAVAGLLATLALCADALTRAAFVAAGLGGATAGRSARDTSFKVATPGVALRRKEWLLLRRDPWLVSQTLMQVLYLLPPAVMLWQSYGEGADKLVVIVPILVMTAGQLAGGLAWLAISGEDAQDLVDSAPISRGLVVKAKVDAVLISLLAVFGPLALVIGTVSPFVGLVAAAGVAASGMSAFAIQYWYRQRSRRSSFRRRQTSSRIATFAEAFTSILWAATAAIATKPSRLAIAVAALALLCLCGARLLAPRET